MKLGVDLSIQDELERLGPKYTYQGKEIEPFSFFSDHSGIKTVRLRIWNDPHDEKGNPYGGGTNDLEATIRLAKRAKVVGMNVLLDFHYSDFFADPSRQICPKAWKGKKFKDVLLELSNFTKKTLLTLKDNDIDVMGVQIGNEITHGSCFPYGKLDEEYNEEKGGGFRGLAELLKTASKAVREVYPKAKVIIHLEHSASFKLQDWFLSSLLPYDVDYDVIGESYYTYWHGALPDFADSISRIKAKYGKEVWLVEAGYEFIDYGDNHKNDMPDVSEEEFVVGNINGRIPFPRSKQGQANFLKELLRICKNLGISYFFYWEPCWIYLPHSGWAKPAGEIYCGYEPHEETGNAWVSETLFDNNGEANPAVDVFTQDFVDNLK